MEYSQPDSGPGGTGFSAGGRTSPLCARVLSARGVRSLEEIQSLYGEKDTLFDPFLLRDMDRAVERIRLAMESGELIVVYGDYDCDGVTSTALLYSYLEAVGANVIYYIPDREQEGYGLNTEAIDFLHNVRGIGLIITGVTTVNVDVEGIGTPGLPCVTKNPSAFVHNGNQMNERIHAYGAKIFLQMTANAGRSTMPGMVKNYISPSAQPNRFDPSVQHREMAREEIRQYTADFVKGAMVAKRAGFGGVEIHAVHEGYLLDQFAIALYNHRTVRVWRKPGKPAQVCN